MVKGDNPLAGPFFVEGAEPGDTLAVKILDLQVDGDTGVGAFAPGFGAHQRDQLHAHAACAAAGADVVLPHRSRGEYGDVQGARYRFLGEDSAASFLRLHWRRAGGGGGAQLGRAGGVRRATWILRKPSVGNTVYFPVNVKGGLLYIGDGHAAMGDGEIAGTAIEVPLKARVQLNVIKGRTIAWPQFENDDAIMTVGAYRPLDDALRIAFTELVHWIHNDYGCRNSYL